jgi:hypothetical protein
MFCAAPVMPSTKTPAFHHAPSRQAWGFFVLKIRNHSSAIVGDATLFWFKRIFDGKSHDPRVVGLLFWNVD